MGKGFSVNEPQNHQGDTNIWLTPKWIIDSLGPFDLDPCAAPEPRPWDTATQHVIESEDGLSKTWHGFVWCNPPYGKHTGVWLERMAVHGNGIALIFARTETQWFQAVADRTSGIFFPKGRVKFHRPDGSSLTNAGAPSCFLLFGELAVARVIESKMEGFIADIKRVS